MIQVGINENVVLTEVKLNDKNTLSFTFNELENLSNEKPNNPFDMINADEVVEVSNGTTVNIFQPNVSEKADVTEEKKIKMVSDDINKVKGIMFHFLKGWLPATEVKDIIKPFAGIDIDANNYNQKILDKNVVAAIHKNMSQAFINAITPLLAEKKPFRLLLVRQSTDKHFATFRGRYIEENQFWESMEVPKEASKLKFTPYEISMKLNDGTPVSKDKTDKPTEQAPVTAQNVFGQ